MIIFDLDGTLVGCEHRRHFVDATNSVQDFYSSCIAIWPVVRAMESLHLNNVTNKDCEIQIWSGRCESVRDITEHWLKYIVGQFTYSKLKMRPIGNDAPNDRLKEMWLEEHLAEGGKPVEAVFESELKTVDMYRKHGIFVFNCCQNDKEF